VRLEFVVILLAGAAAFVASAVVVGATAIAWLLMWSTLGGTLSGDLPRAVRVGLVVVFDVFLVLLAAGSALATLLAIRRLRAYSILGAAAVAVALAGAAIPPALEVVTDVHSCVSGVSWPLERRPACGRR